MIRGLQKKTFADFSGGRVTSENQATIPENCLLVARNILIHSGAPQPIPGYTKVQQLPLTQVQRLFEYERQTDKKQYLVATGKNADGKASVVLAALDGSIVPLELSRVEPDGDYDFISTVHTLYLNNGQAPKKVVNVDGIETLMPWGLKAPISAPSIDIGNGALSLDHGRRYVYCEVCRWTDSEGTTRYHVSAPSDFSAHTGALANKAVTVGDMVARNPNTTHFWIFATQDSAVDTTDFFVFAGEVPASRTSWVDQLTDEELDTAREAPWDNAAPPDNANIAIEYQGRAVLMYDDQVQFSAYDEIRLGMAIECFPASLKFRIPGGIKSITAARVFKIGDTPTLMISDIDEWFQVLGTSVDSFQKRDKVIEPGTVGKKCVLQVHGRLVYLGKDKKLWAWTGVIGDEPVPASVSLHASSSDQLSMNDIDEERLAECELQWYSNGTFDFAILVAPSKNSESGEKDWIQMWDLTPIVGVKTVQGPLPAPVETDFFPTDKFSTSLWAKDKGVPYIYFGDMEDGSVYRWPDGLTFNGDDIDAAFGTAWLKLADGKLRYLWTKLLTSARGAAGKFLLLLQIGHGTTRDVNAEQFELDLAPDDEKQDDTVAKATVNREGQFVKIFAKLPAGEDSKVDAVEIAFKQIGRV